MSKRSEGGLSDNSLTVKAKSKSMNLVSHRNLSIVRQNSQNTTDPKIPRSNRTDKLSASYGQSERSSTDESPFFALSGEDVDSSDSGKPVRGIRTQESSELPGQDGGSSGSRKPVRGTQTQENNSNLELCNMELTNNEYMTKVFQNLQEKLAGIQNLPKFAMEAHKTNM